MRGCTKLPMTNCQAPTPSEHRANRAQGGKLHKRDAVVSTTATIEPMVGM